VNQRILANKIKEMAKKMPILSITGPRQSGKTTLSQLAFPTYDYVNLEHPATLQRAQTDPESFLSQHKKGLIIDEVQKMPELFSYIQVKSDANKKNGEFILTGSQNFLLMEKIAQSLAGRVFVSYLLPFSALELKASNISTNELIFQGFYPRIYDQKIAPIDFYPSYIQTYTERDVRQISEVNRLDVFQRFMKLLAGNIGQILNKSSMGNALGVDDKTIENWLAILETSFIAFRLQPYYKNYKKRLIKSPKIYFYDTGLACNLLGLRSPEELQTHWARGALFENLVLLEKMKNKYNAGERPNLYFWRDSNGNEIDLLEELKVGEVKVSEIKSAATFHNRFLDTITKFTALSNEVSAAEIIYDGKEKFKIKKVGVLNWRDLTF